MPAPPFFTGVCISQEIGEVIALISDGTSKCLIEEACRGLDLHPSL
jgi:hypothetical protein